MGFLGDVVSGFNNGLEKLGDGITNTLEDIKAFGDGLVNEVGAAISAEFGDDVIGINANRVGDIITAIEDYIVAIDGHLEQIKEDSSTDKAMKGEYAAAVKAYVGVACDVCYKITSRLRYFQDRLVTVRDAYAKKDTDMSSAINETAKELDGKWQEYTRQYQ